MQHGSGIALLVLVVSGCSETSSTADGAAADQDTGSGAMDAGTDGTTHPSTTGPSTTSDSSAAPADGEDSIPGREGGAPSGDPKDLDGGSTPKPAPAPDASRQGLTDAAAEDAPCESPAELVAGRNYGPFSLFALRVEPTLGSGTYVLATPPGTTGAAEVFADDELLGTFTYDANASLQDGMEQTVTFPALFELDIRSQTEPDLHALGDHLFDGCHAVVVDTTSTVRVGGQYGAFLVSELSVDATASAGEYTFYTSSGDVGRVDLLRDGATVYSLDYPWQTTIGDNASFVFTFPGFLTMTVTRAAGTSNLFGLAMDLFDGRHVLLVP